MSLRVAAVSPAWFGRDSVMGGGERYAQSLAEAVAAEGVSVDVVSFGPEPQVRELGPNLRLLVLPARRIGPAAVDITSWQLPAALRDCDVVHVHQLFTRCGEAAVLAARALGKPVVGSDHGADTSSMGRRAGFLHLLSAIVCYSDFGASHFPRDLPVVVLKGGVDGDRFTPSAGSPVREGFLYCGRVLPHKGVDLLIEALPRDASLTVCGREGDATYRRDLRRLARGKRVRFVEDAPDGALLDLYRRSRATVLPSVYVDRYGHSYAKPELMGLVLLESMACGTPAICNDVAAMPEFVDDGVTGFVASGVEGLRLALQRLQHDDALVESMGRAGRVAVEQRFDRRVVARALREVYERARPVTPSLRLVAGALA